MGTPLRLVENNMHEVSVQGRAYLFHIPSTSLFESDELVGDIISSLRAAPQTNLWFHTLVMLASRGLGPADVLAELERRFGISGLDEKAARDR